MKNIANGSYVRRLQKNNDRIKRENKIHKKAKPMKMFSKSPNPNRVPRKIRNTKRISKIQGQTQSKIAKAFRVSCHKYKPLDKPTSKPIQVIGTHHAKFRAWERGDCCTMDFRKTWKGIKLMPDGKYKITTVDGLQYIVAKDGNKFIVVTILQGKTQ